MPTQFTGCVGRVVWGHPGKPQDKTDQHTKQKILKDGQPIKVWSFGVAYAKQEFLTHIWPQFAAEAQTGFPQGVPNGFSWKYKDGDTEVDRQGKPYRDREGYAGCYIVSYSTEAFAPPIYKFNPQTGGYDQLTPDQMKTGDYVAVNHNLKVNVETDRTRSSSLYVNPAAIELVGYGKEIISAAAVDPRAAFGGTARALPPGASAAPVLSSGGVGMPGTAPQAPQMPGMPAPMAQPPMQQPGMMPPPMPGHPAPVPVTSGYPAPPAPMPVAPPAPVMFPPAGWTAHPQSPGYFYMGSEVLSEADLRARIVPPPAPDFVQMPGYPAPAPAAPPMPGQMPGMMPPR